MVGCLSFTKLKAAVTKVPEHTPTQLTAGRKCDTRGGGGGGGGGDEANAEVSLNSIQSWRGPLWGWL